MSKKGRARSKPPLYPYLIYGHGLAEYVRTVCEENDWSQNVLAERFGLPAYQLSAWLCGHSHPEPESQEVIAEEMDFDLDEQQDLIGADKLIHLVEALGADLGRVSRWMDLAATAIQSGAPSRREMRAR